MHRKQAFLIRGDPHQNWEQNFKRVAMLQRCCSQKLVQNLVIIKESFSAELLVCPASHSTFGYTLFYKKVVYKKVRLQRPKNKKVKGCNDVTLRKSLTTSFKNPKLSKFKIQSLIIENFVFDPWFLMPDAKLPYCAPLL